MNYAHFKKKRMILQETHFHINDTLRVICFSAAKFPL